MTTLHRVTEITKKIIIGFSIGIASILFILLLVRLVGSIKDTLFPTPPAPPTESFGKLSSLLFPKNALSGSSFSYSLNTLTGTLPQLPDRATVYKIEQPQANLLAFNNAQLIVVQNNFQGQATAVSDVLYSWTQTLPPMLKLTYNILTHDFTITSNFASDPDILAAANLPHQDTAISLAQTYLANFSSFPDDIDMTKTAISLFDIQNGNLTPASSLSTAKVVQVNFFQNNVNNLPIVYPNFPSSNMSVQIGSGATQPQVIGVSFSHKKILTDQSATYPIITAQEAFNDLKTNKAYIAHNDGLGNTVVIKNIYLAYYIGQTPQMYAMPVIVFQGDNNFYAFVSAVTNSQVGN